LNTELFYPAPKGLPVAIRPLRDSNEMLKNLERFDWTSLTESGNADLVRAGALWLYGFLDESHSIAQGLASAEGSYWHALMHRSEGDFSNSKYWYRRAGSHAIFPDLLAAVRQLTTSSQSATAALLGSGDWDPFPLVDAMERAAGGKTEDDTPLLQTIAREEYNLLMGFCLAKR